MRYKKRIRYISNMYCLPVFGDISVPLLNCFDTFSNYIDPKMGSTSKRNQIILCPLITYLGEK